MKGSAMCASWDRLGEGETSMATTLASRTLSVTINRPANEVYRFASNPENLPTWARGLCKSIKRSNGDWIVETPEGPMKVRFVERNALGVLDHYVTPPSGGEIYVPMRVLSNGSGSEVIFTLFRLPDMSEVRFAQDIAFVEHDLRTLKERLERGEDRATP